MDKPIVTTYEEPTCNEEMPRGATVPIGLLTEINAGWRNKKPIINTEKCIRCLTCFIVCPDGVIDISGPVLTINYQFCKGCGICSNECKVNAIKMVEEVE